MNLKFANFATSLLASTISTSDTSLSITSSTGSRFPALGAGDWFPAVLTDADGNHEIVRVTARSGDVLTVTRAQESTTARSFTAGARVDLRITKAVFDAITVASATVNDSSVIGATVKDALNQLLADKLAALDAAYLASLPDPGDVRLTYRTSAKTGWFMLDDGTIGDGSSNSTTRANADTAAVFAVFWPIAATTVFNSDGTSSTKGANAAADFAAHKRLKIPVTLGRAIAVAGSGSGLTARALGAVVGEENHTLNSGEMPNHDHGGATGSVDLNHVHANGAATHKDGVIVIGFTPTNAVSGGGGGNIWYGAAGSTDAADRSLDHSHGIPAAGASGAHNNMQPTAFMNVMVKL